MDVLAHYHMFDYRARCAVAVTTEIVRALQQRHGLDPLTTIALGRAVSCAALLASSLKNGKEYVHLSFAGDGPLAKVVAECNGDGHCRGYTVPVQLLSVLNLDEGDVLPESVGAAMGASGFVTVTRGLAGESQSTYNAVCDFANGEIAADFARYLTESEQIPSAIAAGVKLASDGSVLASGGMLVQKLGGTVLEEQELIDVEQRMALELNLSDRLVAGETIEDLVRLIQGAGGGYGLLMQRPLIFRCTCSREKMMQALVAFSEEQLKEIRDETGKLEVRCQYCAEAKQFRLEELLRH